MLWGSHALERLDRGQWKTSESVPPSDSECAVAGPEDRLLIQGCALYLCLMWRKLQKGGLQEFRPSAGDWSGAWKGALKPGEGVLAKHFHLSCPTTPSLLAGPDI